MSARKATSSTGRRAGGKKIPEVTDGRVKVQVFPNSQLGGVQEMIDGVKRLDLDRPSRIRLARPPRQGHRRLQRAVRLSRWRACPRRDRPGKSEVMQEFNKKLVAEGGIRIIGRLFRGARQMTAKQAVYSPADLQGKRFRGVPIQLWTTMIRGFGAIPTPVEVANCRPRS